jgi:hypothetical protein
LQHGFRAERETETLHVTDETALTVPYGSQRLEQSLLGPTKVRPILAFMNVRYHSPLTMRRI